MYNYNIGGRSYEENTYDYWGLCCRNNYIRHYYFFCHFCYIKKMVCKSDEGNITIMYNDKTLTGYTANGISYDYDGQKEYADQVGVDAYLTEFATWFSNNTTGTCSR